MILIYFTGFFIFWLLSLSLYLDPKISLKKTLIFITATAIFWPVMLAAFIYETILEYRRAPIRIY